MSKLLESLQTELPNHLDYNKFLNNTALKSSTPILSDEEYRILLYFTAVGSGKVFNYDKQNNCPEMKILLNSLDNILQKLDDVEVDKVYRMDTFNTMSKNMYMKLYKNYQEKNIALQIPWSLSTSMSNWNKEHRQYPIWEIELLPNNSKAHPIYPYIEDALKSNEQEVRFESNVFLQIVSVSEQDGFPYIKMKEITDCGTMEIKTL